MKKIKKLTLNTETVRTLTSAQLGKAVGGAPTGDFSDKCPPTDYGCLPTEHGTCGCDSAWCATSWLC